MFETFNTIKLFNKFENVAIVESRRCYVISEINLRFVCRIYILLSRESDGGAIFWMNPHLLRS